MIVREGLPLGVDFSGGTLVLLRFEESVTEEAVRGALDSVAGEKVVRRSGDADANEIQIRLPEIEREEGGSLEEGALAVVAAIEQADLGSFELLQQDIVGPVIGRDLQRRGIYAFLGAMTGILIYIGLRFRFSFAVGAIVAVAHDILVTVSFLLFFGYELSLNVVAAILTITGYSVNDTIVIFDRVRENLRSMRRDSFDLVVNTSINHTLGRTIITSGTTGDGGAHALRAWRRSVTRLCLHDAGGRRRGHLLDYFHRGDDCHFPESTSCPAPPDGAGPAHVGGAIEATAPQGSGVLTNQT